MTTVADLIRHLKPCQDALQWAANYTNPVQAWNECPRGDWMLWLLGKTNHSNPWTDGRKALLACCLDCAETAKHLWPEKQLEVISMSVAVLRCWIAGTASADAAKKARRDLYAAYAYAVAAAYVASAAAAYAAAYAAYAADDAYDAAAAAAKKDKYLFMMADIGLEALKQCNSPGCQYLDLVNA